MPKPVTNKEYLLAELRCAALRSRLITADIENLGIALKSEILSVDEALMHLVTAGLADWCSPKLADMFKAAEREAERKRWEGNGKTETVAGKGN